jgi:formylglycine-generating enzyme required for sulfatase activity
MTIYDNIGCTFDYINSNIVITGPLPGYLSLSDQHIGSTVPYLARNIISSDKIDFEVGVAEVVRDGLTISIANRSVSASSNNNKTVDFSQKGNKQFYLFVNTSNFNVAFNNVVTHQNNFSVDNTKTIYLIDFSQNANIIAKLPQAQINKSLEIEFKTLNDGTLIIRDAKQFTLTINGSDQYVKLVSDGDKWIVINDVSNNDSFRSQSTNNFSALSDPAGDNYSLQYKVDGTTFNGADIYWDPTSNELLFGDVDSDNAKNIIPSSGDIPVIFNQTRDGSDFIVYGTGNVPGYPEKNLYFTNSGKLGINMPSGLKPATVLHIVNTLCKEGIRLENWGSCFPADITLYQNSIDTPTSSQDNVTFAQVTFSAKNSANVKRNFAQIRANRKSVSSSQGELRFLVGDTSSPVDSGVVTMYTNPDETKIQHLTNSLDINKNSSSLKSNTSIVNVSSNQIGIDPGSSTNIVNISGSVNVNDSIKLNYVNEPNSLLAIDANNVIVAATGFEIPGIHDSFWPYEPQDNANKIGGKDLTWDRFRSRSINVDELCLTANVLDIVLTDPAPITEFAVGDQIAIYNSENNVTQYRNISDITVVEDAITGFSVDQSIILSGVLSVYSTTRGGVLTNGIYTSGVVSDSTDVILSTRPGVSTLFNTKQKNIDFLVYGTEESPALSILANASVEDKPSGIYFRYATQTKDYLNTNIAPFAARINNNGNGDTSNANSNAANYKEAADVSVWPHRVSAVGTNGKASFYGTYDQNGNVYEWIEDDIKLGSISTTQYICGGSWRTTYDEALRGYIPTPRATGLDDVGFRIVSQAGFSNSSVEQPLGLKFTRVDNPNNLADPNPLYTETSLNRFTTKTEPAEIQKQNLGVVNYVYNISSVEVTNSQYVSFLNSVATGTAYPTNLYRTEMTSNDVGGILRSGDGTSESPYVYSAKNNMQNAPVVFVDYLSSLRFINWLSNGALSGDGAVESLEDGSYAIEGESLSVTKKRNRGYYLPTLNEWHKAAYYIPIDETLSNPTSAVTIRTSTPHEYANGQISSLTVNGHLYADNIKIGNNESRFIETRKSGEYFNILLGPDNVVYDVDETTGAESYYSSFISNTGIQFATTGNITFVSKINPLNVTSFTPSGVYVSSKIVIANVSEDGSISNGIELTPEGTNLLDDTGSVVAGGTTPGPNGGFVYKDIDTNNLFASDRFIIEKFVEASVTGYYPKISGTPNNSVIYNDTNGYLSATGLFTFGTVPEGAIVQGNNIVSVYSVESGVTPGTLCANQVLIGPILETFKGSILTHNGLEPAVWKTNTYLQADGVSWTRTDKRAVKILSPNEIQFVNLNEAEGGTGPVSLQNIEEEFSVEETIALYNLNREVFYVKVAKTELVYNAESYPEQEGLWDTENDQTNLILKIVPPIPETWFENEATITTSLGEMILGYAFTPQRGAYFHMEIEPSAVRAFDKEDVYDDESSLPYPITRFKPSTSNTISIRPNVNTAFNKTAEDIDFIIYGYRQTFLNRYEPDWFQTDSSHTPIGLTPAFRVHAHIENSVLGSLTSGVFRDTNIQTEGEEGLVDSIASGIHPDLRSKITVNLNEPYVVTRLSNVKSGIITKPLTDEATEALEKEYGLEIPAEGALISGTLDLTTYADLSIGGTTYSSGIIAKEIALTPLYEGELPVPYQLSLTERLYVPNYPLTINSYGQIVSLIPPPTPSAPDAPTNVVGEARNGSVVLGWNAPEDNGGSNILAYIIEYSSNLGSTWTTFDQLDSNDLPTHPDKNTQRVVDNLNNGSSYIFKVYAINGIGKGEYSDNSDPVTPQSNTPSAPRNILVQGSAAGEIRTGINIRLTWSVPASTPIGASIAGYKVERLYDDGIKSIKDEVSWTTVTDLTTNTYQDMQNIPLNEYVYFRVTAILDTDLGGGLAGVPGIYRSPGTGADPRIDSGTTTTTATDYNFGTLVFTGSC